MCWSQNSLGICCNNAVFYWLTIKLLMTMHRLNNCYFWSFISHQRCKTPKYPRLRVGCQEASAGECPNPHKWRRVPPLNAGECPYPLKMCYQALNWRTRQSVQKEFGIGVSKRKWSLHLLWWLCIKCTAKKVVDKPDIMKFGFLSEI